MKVLVKLENLIHTMFSDNMCQDFYINNGGQIYFAYLMLFFRPFAPLFLIFFVMFREFKNLKTDDL